jgi:hypothetical protein
MEWPLFFRVLLRKRYSSARDFFFSALVLASLVAFCSTREARANFLFDFDNQTPYTVQTPFSDTNGGITANFSTPGSNPYALVPNVIDGAPQFHSLTGNVLESPYPLPGAGAVSPLVVQFSQPLRWLSLTYAYDGTSSDTFSLRAFSGGPTGTAAGSALTVTGSLPDGFFYPEGVLTFFPKTSFDTVVLSTTAIADAIDNIAGAPVNGTPPPTATPEPPLLALGGIGALGLAVVGWRRQPRSKRPSR